MSEIIQVPQVVIEDRFEWFGKKALTEFGNHLVFPLVVGH